MATHERLAEECVARARKTLGDGWSHVSVDLRWGLVAANILGLQISQDESINPAKVVARTEQVYNHAYNLIHGK